MRRWAFILSFLGIFGLFLLLIFSNGRQISGSDELSKLEVNNKIIVKGIVQEERKFGNSYLLVLDNNIELICNCYGYIGKEIKVLGLVNEFNGKKRIDVLRIIENS